MYCVKMYQLRETEKFMDVVDACEGDVFVEMQDGMRGDLKREEIVRSMLRTLRVGEQGLRLCVSDENDYKRLFRYILNAGKTCA